MKNIILMLIATLIFMNVGNIQKISPDKVPNAVSTAFKTKFPMVSKVKWEMEKENEYEAIFKLNGKETTANFDNLGKWMETETEIKVSELPQSVQLALKNDFKGFKIEEACKIESAKDGICYEAEIEKGKESFDVIFTQYGKVLSKTKIDEKEKKD